MERSSSENGSDATSAFRSSELVFNGLGQIAFVGMGSLIGILFLFFNVGLIIGIFFRRKTMYSLTKEGQINLNNMMNVLWYVLNQTIKISEIIRILNYRRRLN